MKITDLMNTSGSADDMLALKNSVDEIRKAVYARNKSLLKNNGVSLSFDEFSRAPDGRFTIPYNGIEYDCLFKREPSSDKLFVFLNGYRKAWESEPTFKRWSYYNYINANMLNIDDPMCKLHPKLGLGWYYGTEERCYCDDIVDIVKEFAAQNGFNEIVFYASSGGGFAALYCACKIENSTVVAINPQIVLSMYTSAEHFQKVTGLDLGKRDKFNRNHLTEVIKANKGTKIILIENCASDIDMVQLNALCSELGTNYHYGLTKPAPNILLWVYEAETNAPHNAQEYTPMVFAILYLLGHFDDAMQYSELFLTFGELWKDHYDLAEDNQRITQQKGRHIELLSAVANADKEAIRVKHIDVYDNIIPAKDLRFNYIVINNALETNSLYKLSVGNVSVLSGETREYSILVKDTVIDSVDFLKTVKIGGNATLYFSTAQDTKGKELRIYSGEAGKTNNISLKIGYCRLEKISVECKE